MNAMKTFGVGMVSFVLILVVVIGGYNLLALNLGTVSGDYFKGGLAIVVLLGGGWLTLQGLGYIGKPFMIGASLILIAITVSHRVPGVAAFFTQSAKAADRAAERLAVDLSAARVIPCDRTTPNLRFFEGDAGKPLVWLSETENGRLICYDRPGRHPQTRKVFVEADERLVAAVLRQEPVGASAVVAPPQPPPVRLLNPHAELPDISEGPIPR